MLDLINLAFAGSNKSRIWYFNLENCNVNKQYFKVYFCKLAFKIAL